jgi:hypothetical protein
MSDILLWKWRFAEYTDAKLSEIYRRSEPGKEGNAALAAMEILAERAAKTDTPSDPSARDTSPATRP